jgi:DNA-binding NarL/FixJ family response regulator
MYARSVDYATLGCGVSFSRTPEERMITLSTYMASPVAGIGLRTIFDAEESFRVAGTFYSLEELEAHLHETPPSLLLLEVTPKLDLSQLKRIASISPGTAIILWFDTISGEYLSQAMALGVLGAVGRNSSVRNHIECFRTVAGGYKWIDAEASRKLHATNRIALAPRERHVMGLIALGLSNKDIAWSLGLTEGTVKVYMSKLFDKVGVSDRFELGLLALKNLNANHATAASTPRAVNGGKVMPLSMPEFLSLDKTMRV